MNIINILKKGHSIAQYKLIIKYIGKDPKRFSLLVSVFLDGPWRITQRASWPMNVLAETHPELFRPHLRKIIQNLSTPGIHDAVKRNTVRMLQFLDIPPSLQGIATNSCFELLQRKTEPIAVKVFSMTVLANLTRQHPELRSELIILIEDMLPYGSAGIVSRGKKILKLLSLSHPNPRPTLRTIR
jgi:hypothetical protein